MWHLIRNVSLRHILHPFLALLVMNLQAGNVEGREIGTSAATGGWLMYMGDAARTGFADTYIPSQPEVKWERFVGSFSITSVVSDGIYAYLTSYSGNLSCVSVETNTTVWEFSTASIVATPLIVNNFLVVGDEEGTIFIIERYSGYLCRKLFINHGCSQHLLYFNDKIFIPGGNWLTALDVNGTVLWNHCFEREISAPPVGYLNNLYILTGNQIWCLMQNETLWRREFDFGITSVMGATGKLVLTTDEGKLIAIDAITGETRWEREMNSEVFSPAYFNGILFATTRRGTIYAISANDGSEIWNFSTQFEVFQSPLVNRHSIIFASGTTLYCVKQNTGEIVWTHQLKAPLVTPLSLVSSNFFGGDVHGRLYCISAPKPELKISVTPSQPTLYERGQVKITFSVLAGVMPAVNASVKLAVVEGTLSNYSGFTDAEGIFVVVYTAPFVKARENITLSAFFSFSGYRNTTKNITITVLPTPSVELYLNISETRVYSGSTVEIRVCVFRLGKPVEGASVYLFCSDECIAYGFTDRNGIFAFNYKVPTVERETQIVIEARVYGSYTTSFVEKSTKLSVQVLPLHNNEEREFFAYLGACIGCALLVFFFVLFIRERLKK